MDVSKLQSIKIIRVVNRTKNANKTIATAPTIKNISFLFIITSLYNSTLFLYKNQAYEHI